MPDGLRHRGNYGVRGRARWADAIEARPTLGGGASAVQARHSQSRAPRSKACFAGGLLMNVALSPYSRANAHLCEHNRICPAIWLNW